MPLHVYSAQVSIKFGAEVKSRSYKLWSVIHAAFRCSSKTSPQHISNVFKPVWRTVQHGGHISELLHPGRVADVCLWTRQLLGYWRITSAVQHYHRRHKQYCHLHWQKPSELQQRVSENGPVWNSWVDPCFGLSERYDKWVSEFMVLSFCTWRINRETPTVFCLLDLHESQPQTPEQLVSGLIHLIIIGIVLAISASSTVIIFIVRKVKPITNSWFLIHTTFTCRIIFQT